MDYFLPIAFFASSGASSLFLPNSAPNASASSFLTAAPPMIIATLPFNPAAFNASSSFARLFFAGTVFTEIAIMFALFSFALSTKTCGATLFPTSIVLNPARFSDLLTASYAVSCISGSMLPITIIPNGFSGSGGSFSIIDLSHDI